VEQEALLWLAQYSMKNSEYESAITYYTQIVDRFHDTTQLDQIHYELGQAYEMQGSADQALAQYKEVSDKDPSLSAKVKLAIAGIFSKEFDPQKALNAYQNIAASDPDYARDAYLKMAQIYRNTQNYEKEIETYEKTMRISQSKASTSNAELLFNVADAYEAMGNLEKSIDYYLKIPVQYSDQTPWIVKGYLRVAKIFEDRKDWDGAKVTYMKIIQLKTEESKYAMERMDWIKKK
jgi:tetratricopeptide (TPR) repeat protein